MLKPTWALRPIEDGRAEGGALGDKCYIPFVSRRAEDGCVKASARPDNTRPVGPQNSHSVLLADPLYFLFEFQAILGRLRIAFRDDHDPIHTGLATGFYYSRDRRSRARYHRQVHFFSDACYVSVARHLNGTIPGRRHRTCRGRLAPFHSPFRGFFGVHPEDLLIAGNQKVGKQSLLVGPVRFDVSKNSHSSGVEHPSYITHLFLDPPRCIPRNEPAIDWCFDVFVMDHAEKHRLVPPPTSGSMIFDRIHVVTAA